MKRMFNLLSMLRFKKKLASTNSVWGEEKPWVNIGILFLLAVILYFFLPRGKALHFADLKEGSISTRRIIAPFDFEILKTQQEYERDRNAAAERVLHVYHRNQEIFEEGNRTINIVLSQIWDFRQKTSRNEALVDLLADSLFQNMPVLIFSQEEKHKLILPQSGVSDITLKELQSALLQMFRDIMAVGIYEGGKAELSPHPRLLLTGTSIDSTVNFSDFFSLESARQRIMDRLDNRYFHEYDRLLKRFGLRLLDNVLRPNLIYNEEVTENRIRESMARVPMSTGFVQENEKIVDKNERITVEIRKKLDSLAQRMTEMQIAAGGIKYFLPMFGRFLFVCITLFVFMVFVYFEQPQILKDKMQLLLISIIILLVSFMTFLLHRIDLTRIIPFVETAREYLVPVALGAILLSIIFGIKIGYAGTAFFAVLIGGLWGNEFNIAFISFFVGVAGVLTTVRVRYRGSLVYAIYALTGAYLIVITVLGFLHSVPFEEILIHFAFGTFNAILTPILAFGLLPLVESLFNITTDFSLLELSNLNHPLLSRLSLAAPGTYHHSILVGNLAGAAAQAVGANSLLARVGSYYHDIGKAEKAEYFVENQLPGENPHAKLTPRMSALILMNHAKRGLELAARHKLPLAVIDIIRQHHGTTLMVFFYEKAKNGASGEPVGQDEYIYPGPMPQTKEAAIVMLADVVEAATRAMKKPTHNRLRATINELIDGRFQEGQLNQSPLTLRDLEKIKSSFLTILSGMFHTRIDYPEQEKKTVQ